MILTGKAKIDFLKWLGNTTRREATRQAILKANKIYNETNQTTA